MIIDPPWLCLITSESRAGGRNIVDIVSQAVTGGVNMVQLRSNITDDVKIKELSLEIREVTLSKCLFIVNDDYELAIASGADGVHFKENTHIPVDLKRGIDRDFIVGQSVHSIKSALHAQAKGADYVIAGTIYKSKTHPGGFTKSPIFISEMYSRIQLPIIGIGGIDHDNVVEVMNHKAAGVAVIGSIIEATDPEESASIMWSHIKNYRTSGEKNGNCG